MAKIKIKDLPVDQKVSQEELKKVLGGAFILPSKIFTPFSSTALKPSSSLAGAAGHSMCR